MGNSNQPSNRMIIRALVIGVLFTLIGAFVLAYQFLPGDVVDLTVGQIAPIDIFAPSQVTYTSEIETKATRDRAQSAITMIYSPPDPQVARQQVSQLRKIFDYMETVRADPYGSLSEKFEWLDAIPDLNVSDTVIDQVLIMEDEEWAKTRLEALAILSQGMSAELRESQITALRRQLPNKVSLDTPEAQANVIVALVGDMIKPNTFPDEVRTAAEREAAIEAVEPVEVKVERGELIVPAGQMVTPKQLEILEALDVQQPEFNWRTDFVPPVILMLLVTLIIGVYLAQYIPRVLHEGNRLTLLMVLLLAFISIAKFMFSEDSIVAYLYPMAALSMMVVILINAQLSFLLTTILAFLAGYMGGGESQHLVIYLILSGWMGALALGQGQRVNALLWAGVYVGLVNTAVILIAHLPTTSLEIVPMGILLLEGLLNGIFSAGLALIGLFAIGNLFGLTTSIQLLDLGRPTQPLLRQLLLKAPGTYHHSLMVSNLGEQAAERIGADALLVRVMAYYHDIGKMQRPYFFIENQPEGMNVHEKLDPQISAQIIISHVKDGLDLARKYRLPPAIQAGIAQHHGTSLVKFFYYQAIEAAKERQFEVDESKFHYPGPKPQSKENGILMLADVSESTVRALKPRSAEEIDEIVQKVIAHHLDAGQLDECELTIADLRKIRTAFVDILQGVHHPRIKYPEQVKAEVEGGEAKRLPASASQESPAERPAPVLAPKPLTSGSSPVGPASLVQRE